MIVTQKRIKYKDNYDRIPTCHHREPYSALNCIIDFLFRNQIGQ